MNTIRKKIIISGLALLMPIITMASDMVSSQSVKAKIIDVEKKKTPNQGEFYQITIDVKGKVKDYRYSPIVGDYYYKLDYSKAPIERIRKNLFYNVEIGHFKQVGKTGSIQEIIYIGRSPFAFERIE